MRRCSIAPGDRVGIVSPGFAVKPEALEAGVAWLESRGYRTVVGPHALDRDGYLAGSDASRLADLRAMFRDPGIRAIWFARGGYGTARLLDRLPWRSLARNPKLLVGYSDLTALFAAADRRVGLGALYGPVVTELGQADAFHARSLAHGLAGRPVEVRLRKRQFLAPGRCAGRLIGGNLSVLSHLLGTRFAPDPRQAILLLEEVGEPVYRIDRMLTQLRLAGFLDRVRGVLLGGFSVSRRRRFPPDRSLDDVFREFLEPLGVPVVRDLQVGHLAGKRTVPLGARVTLDSATRLLRFDA